MGQLIVEAEPAFAAGGCVRAAKAAVAPSQCNAGVLLKGWKGLGWMPAGKAPQRHSQQCQDEGSKSI